MHRLHSYCVALALAFGWCSAAHAYKNCGLSQDTWSFWDSSYFVGELEYDVESGGAMGTVTHYNFSKRGPGEIRECHVTYEFSGIYEPVSALFLLDADRTNRSQSCSGDFVDSRFPAYVSHTLQLHQDGNIGVELSLADSGEIFAQGNLGEGSLVYRTEETCVPR